MSMFFFFFLSIIELQYFGFIPYPNCKVLWLLTHLVVTLERSIVALFISFILQRNRSKRNLKPFGIIKQKSYLHISFKTKVFLKLNFFFQTSPNIRLIVWSATKPFIWGAMLCFIVEQKHFLSRSSTAGLRMASRYPIQGITRLIILVLVRAD